LLLASFRREMEERLYRLAPSLLQEREIWKNGYITLLLASCKRERWMNGFSVLLLASCKRERWKYGYVALLPTSYRRERWKIFQNLLL
jgi:hypothetical protein